MRPALPGTPVVEHLRNAPAPGLAVGFVLIWIGIILVGFGPLGESSKNQLFTYMGIGGAIIPFIGFLTMVISWSRLERSWKNPR